MEYLERQFEARNPCITALTTKGSLLKSLRFATEQRNDDDAGLTNDDLILECATHFVDHKQDGVW